MFALKVHYPYCIKGVTVKLMILMQFICKLIYLVCCVRNIDC